jgi:hypothetical protein
MPTATPQLPAHKWFWGLSDEDQAQFLIEIERISRADVGSSANTQWYYMIGHLKTCECSNENARQMVKDWAGFLKDAQ